MTTGAVPAQYKNDKLKQLLLVDCKFILLYIINIYNK